MTDTTILDDFKDPSENDHQKYFLAYFGPEDDYYMRRYLKLQRGQKFTFNIGSFLAGLFWLMYRKLYIQMAIVLVALIASSYIEEILLDLFRVATPSRTWIDLVINLAWWVVFGFCGNYLYLKHAEKNVNRILATTFDEERRLELLKKKGGTSYSPFYVLGVLVLILIFLFWYGGQ